MFELKKKMLHFKLVKHTKFYLDETAIISFIHVTSITHHNKSYGNEKYIKTTKFLRKPMVSKSKNSTAFNGRLLIR